MKIKDECQKCGAKARKYTITIKPEDRDRFLAFIEVAQQRGITGTIPPSKYPRHPALIPAYGENPCGHCSHGEEMVGPSGCGRGQTCLAYSYFQMSRLSGNTSVDTHTLLQEFACAVPNARWLFPTTKKQFAKSAGAALPLPPQTILKTDLPASSAKREARKPKWRKPSSSPSPRASKPSSKRR